MTDSAAPEDPGPCCRHSAERERGNADEGGQGRADGVDDQRPGGVLVKDQLIMEATDDDGNVLDQFAVSMYEIMGHMIMARREARITARSE